MSVLIETSLGDIVVDLFVNEISSASTNFLKLCKIKYYHHCLFYNVQQDFVIQTGDPSGTGKGGESIYSLYGSKPRYLQEPLLPLTKKGYIGMVWNPPYDEVTGKGLLGSQFMFYMTNDIHSSLHQRGMVIGEVAEGMDVLEKINQAYVDTEGRPYQDIRIHHTVILDDPFPDPEGMKVPDTSPKRADLPLNVVRLDEYETFEDKDEITLAKEIREKEARSNAVALEIIGDLPFADIKPPENVLFVCRLNPVTQDEDLAQIFGRFGTLRSCEVVKDSLTQASLCYAFIEFEDKQACEMAYFKMDNVLIDDRRIKVDFSQSVSKLHHEWILARKKQGMGSGYGGFAHLTKKTQYREETWKSLDSKPSESSYPLIFEHDADLKSGKEVSSQLHELESIQPQSHSPERTHPTTPKKRFNFSEHTFPSKSRSHPYHQHSSLQNKKHKSSTRRDE